MSSSYDILDVSLSFSCIRGELYGSVIVSFSKPGDFHVTDIESVPVPFMNLHMASNFVEFVLPYARNEYAGGKSVWPPVQRLFTVDFSLLFDPSLGLEPIEDVYSALAYHGMISWFAYQRKDELPPVFFNCVDELLNRIEKLYPEAFEGDL